MDLGAGTWGKEMASPVLRYDIFCRYLLVVRGYKEQRKILNLRLSFALKKWS